MIDDKFLKPYDPIKTEDTIYRKWMDSGFFNPDVCIEKGVTDANADKFSIVLPPPNVTGTLHIGHAAMLTIEDIAVRYNRMLGKKTLWIPGTDHAAIATQVKVEKILQKEGVRRHDLGRDKFLERVDQFAQESHDAIVNQIKKMGSSVDWTREAFTLDAPRKKAVFTAFENMYSDGLIYQKNKVINWDPKGQTVISDDEVDHTESKGKLYYFKYSADFPITIATTRPETKFGDTAIAVNPKDDRYSKLIGQTIKTDFMGTELEIKIIEDREVDMEFGTGAVGVTPAHSMSDYDMSIRHELPIRQVINEYAKMETPDTPEVHGKKTSEARVIIATWLEEKGLIEKVEEIDQSISTAERTGAIIEPLPKLQWFINVNKEFPMKNSKIDGIKDGDIVTLKKLMLQSVQNEQIEIIPERFEKVYYNWIENLHDWCISRQIWYGHQIPVWYRNSDGTDASSENHDELQISEIKPEGENWIQDSDTLDTWFSSGLWTFSTLGWPEKTADLKTYHPTTLMETGYDILFFWVARMILMSTYHIGDIPFEKVYLHGLVRDTKNQKMSKSLGNVIDPLDMSVKYGSDAVRMSLIIGTGPGNDSKIAEDKIRAYKKFSNKIWNASRFVLENMADEVVSEIPEKINFDEIVKMKLTVEHQKHIDELQTQLTDITLDLENYRYYLAGEKLYHYFWHTFADVIIEEAKKDIELGGEKGISAQKMLYSILVISLKSMHPFIPFITEEIWQSLPKKEIELLMVSKWVV
jgi:valyl-tRNA synthetase